jgi:hypothetical protein
MFQNVPNYKKNLGGKWPWQTGRTVKRRLSISPNPTQLVQLGRQLSGCRGRRRRLSLLLLGEAGREEGLELSGDSVVVCEE